MSISMLGALIHADPKTARERILRALEEAEGDRKAAAESLGTTHRSFYRFVERLKLWPEIDRLMDQRGFTKIAGPPRTSRRIRDAVLAADGNLGRAARTMGIKLDVLRARITELDMWDDLNKVLRAAGCSTIDRAAS